MNRNGFVPAFLIFCLFPGSFAWCDESLQGEIKCPPGTAQSLDSSGICAEPAEPGALLVPEGRNPLRLPVLQEPGADGSGATLSSSEKLPLKPVDRRISVHLFWGRGCPHCEEEQDFLLTLKRTAPALEIKDYEVWYDKQNARLLAVLLKARGMKPSGVPVTFIDDQVFFGFSRRTGEALAAAIEACGLKPCRDPLEAVRNAAQGPVVAAGGKDKDTTIDIPLVGPLDTGKTSLPVLTLVIAGLDSFNPCAFFVLLSLLGLLVHARSRNRILLIGGVFVFFSGFIYFLFMAAWLSLFLVMGHVTAITTIAGAVSVLIALVNIKDFFLFKKGVSLTIPDSAKPRLFDRMRRLMRSTSLLSVLAGTTVLALVANSYELLCTAGFPMVYTRILTLGNLAPATYYLYLAAYNIIYVVPLFVIVLAFAATLGNRKLSERQGRILKLLSGTMMLGLGGVLLADPALLNSVKIPFLLLAAALAVSLPASWVMQRIERKQALH
jgi:glutaredoxin